jgi:hypothetical protein
MAEPAVHTVMSAERTWHASESVDHMDHVRRQGSSRIVPFMGYKPCPP